MRFTRPGARAKNDGLPPKRWQNSSSTRVRSSNLTARDTSSCMGVPTCDLQRRTQGSHCNQQPTMEPLKLTIEGMSCEHCVRAVKNRLTNTPGVAVEEVAIGSAQLRRSEEHTSELQSPCNLVCRLLLEK